MTTKRKATGVKKHTFRSAYNLGNEDYSETFSEGITEKHHKDECDINKILAQFMETGILPESKIRNPQYGDVSDHNFQDIQNQLANAKTLFEELPELVKARFNNEPFEFLRFVEDEKNHPELVEMGLAHAPQPELTAQTLEQSQAGKETTSLSADNEDPSEASAGLST